MDAANFVTYTPEPGADAMLDFLASKSARFTKDDQERDWYHLVPELEKSGETFTVVYDEVTGVVRSISKEPSALFPETGDSVCQVGTIPTGIYVNGSAKHIAGFHVVNGSVQLI